MAHDVAKENLLHAYASCTDPDCELHHPEVIETYDERATAKAWFTIGMFELQERVEQSLRDFQIDDPRVWALIDAAIGTMGRHHELREFTRTDP